MSGHDRRRSRRFFQNVPYIYRKIKVLQEVGLGLYPRWGQVGCNPQRRRSPARESWVQSLGKKDTGKTFLYSSTNRLPAFTFEDIPATCWTVSQQTFVGQGEITVPRN